MRFGMCSGEIVAVPVHIALCFRKFMSARPYSVSSDELKKRSKYDPSVTGARRHALHRLSSMNFSAAPINAACSLLISPRLPRRSAMRRNRVKSVGSASVSTR